MTTHHLEQAYATCVAKTLRNIDRIGPDLREFPAAPDGNYFNPQAVNILELRHVMAWTPSFFTGMACLALATERNLECLRWLNRLQPLYAAKVFDTLDDTMHDLGFLYSPYAVALHQLTGDPQQRRIALKAADELAKRFMLKGSYIRAWGRMDDVLPAYVSPELAQGHFFTQSQGLAIIDCMMNLPLLFWASDTTGHPFYRNVASAHADTTRRYFIRPDWSVYHAYRFDPATGAPLQGCNYCGYGDDTYWARGATWAIYGFAIAYRYTRNPSYLETAQKLADAFIAELDDRVIPVWDFRLPAREPRHLDTSAAAIAVCGFQEILAHVPDDAKLKEWSDRLLTTLAQDEFTDDDPECPGVLKHSNGQQTYTIFGDYYYMEALARRLYGLTTCW